jgi:hypothetical protein
MAKYNATKAKKAVKVKSTPAGNLTLAISAITA